MSLSSVPLISDSHLLPFLLCLTAGSGVNGKYQSAELCGETAVIKQPVSALSMNAKLSQPPPPPELPAERAHVPACIRAHTQAHLHICARTHTHIIHTQADMPYLLHILTRFQDQIRPSHLNQFSFKQRSKSTQTKRISFN